MKMNPCPVCVVNDTDDKLCDDCLLKAMKHRDGDHKCGRKWACGCVVCRLCRALLGMPSPHDLAILAERPLPEIK